MADCFGRALAVLALVLLGSPEARPEQELRYKPVPRQRPVRLFTESELARYAGQEVRAARAGGGGGEAAAAMPPGGAGRRGGAAASSAVREGGAGGRQGKGRLLLLCAWPRGAEGEEAARPISGLGCAFCFLALVLQSLRPRKPCCSFASMWRGEAGKGI